MGRRALGTLLLAGFVIIGTSAGSGGCGGGSTPTSQVGAGGEQGEGGGGDSSEPASSEHSTAEHTTTSPSEDHPTDEKTESGKSPCSFAPGSIGLNDKTVTATGHVICPEAPNMLGGTLVLVFSHFQGGDWVFVEDSRISVTSLDIGKELTVSTSCNEGLWLAYWEGSGTDANGHDFTDVYNFPAPPHRVDSCP